MFTQVLVRTLLSFLVSAYLGSVSSSMLGQSVVSSQEMNPVGASKDKTSDQVTNHLRGTVVDHTGAVVPNFSSVEVRAIAAGSSTADKTSPPMLALQTSHEGEFSAALAPGLYEICVRLFPKSCRTVVVEGAKSIDYLVLKINPAEDHASSELLDNRIRIIAGPGGENCGHVRIKENPRRATGCALRAFNRRKAFYVRYDDRGVDSETADGVAGDSSGNVFYVEFDSMGMDTDGIRPGITMPDGFHTVVVACSKPVRLRKTREGKLTCPSDGRWLRDDK